MVRFFIARPIFAIVIATLIGLAGVLSIAGLPIEQYPTIAPPAVQIQISYPGASAATVENTVVQVIEQQMSGLDNLIYMASTSDDFGQGVTTLTFAPGTNADIAQVQVQNKLQLAVPLLPQIVQLSGIRVTKSSASYFLVVGFVSSDNSMSRYDIANYVASNIQDPISRINGVGNLNVFGTQYAMRIWLDQNRLISFGLTPLDDVRDYLLKEEARMVDGVFQISGFNFAGRGQTQGLVFVHLKDWSERSSSGLKVRALVGRIAARFRAYKDAVIIPINPPALPGLGTASGFDFELQDRAGLGHDKLMQARDQLLGLARNDSQLALVRANGLDDNPSFKVDIDREKATAFGVALSDIDQAFSVAWGSRYVNNFLDTDGRIKKVIVQADAPFRMAPEDLGRLYVRNARGEMVPFTSFAKGSWRYASPKLERYNGISAVEIQGQAAAGLSTGQAMDALERHARELPSGAGFEWTGVSLQEKQAGAQAPRLYALSIVVVFLSLAALYESWSIPFSVILGVPVGVLGALVAASAFGMANDVYFQVGLITTVGLSAKNAILIVEFARELVAQGRTAAQAAIEAARLRMRPILMTSMAFILGVLPLALARGAGSGGQNAIGTGVIGGMLAATFVAPFLIPMFFVLVTELRHRPARAQAATMP